MRSISKQGCNFISSHEGKCNYLYGDSANINNGFGYLTIGVGHLSLDGDYYLKGHSIKELELYAKDHQCMKRVKYNLNGKEKAFYVRTCDWFIKDFYITDEEIDSILQHELARFCNAIDKFVTTPLSDNQFSACVSLAYNIGIGTIGGSKGFLASSLYKAIQKKQYELVRMYFSRYTRSCGKEMPGLVQRRKAEADLFFTPDNIDSFEKEYQDTIKKEFEKKLILYKAA